MAEVEKNDKKKEISKNTDTCNNEQRSKKSSCLSWLSITWLILFSGLLLALGNLVYKNQNNLKNEVQTQQKINKDLLNSIALQQNDLRTLKSDTNNLKLNWSKLQSYNADTEFLVTLTEIKSIIELANLNLQFNQDASSAIALLNIANQKIIQLKNPILLPAQKILADDILKLRQNEIIDKANVLTRINALINQVLSLKNIDPNFNLTSSKTALDKNKIEKGWRAGLQKSLVELKSLIVIRHQEKPFEPFMAPEQQDILIQTLTQLLNQSAWAIIHNNASVYHWSLSETDMLLEKYFSNNPQKNDVILREIKALNEIKFGQINFNLEPLLKTLSQAQEKKYFNSLS